jgi:hypothetical protein
MAPIPTTEKVVKDVRVKGLQRQVTECTKEDGESAKPDSHRRNFSFKPYAFYENLNISSNMGYVSSLSPYLQNQFSPLDSIESPIDRTAMATDLEALEEGIEGQLVKDADACAREEQLQAMCSGLLEQIEKEEFRAAPLSRESAYNVGKTLQLDLGKFTLLVRHTNLQSVLKFKIANAGRRAK